MQPRCRGLAITLALALLLLPGCGDRAVTFDGGVRDGFPPPPAPDMSPWPQPQDLRPIVPDLPPRPDLPLLPDLPPMPDLFVPPDMPLGPPEASPMPPGCVPHIEGGPGSCKPASTWAGYVATACQQYGLPLVVSLTFSGPCGPEMYHYASYGCCPVTDGP